VERDKVSLAPHNNDWAKEFQRTKDELLAVLGDDLVEVRHVGSTAVKGIVAKPILDAAIVIKSMQSHHVAGMEAAGYEFCGEQEPGRYLFVKRRNGSISTHHIHCYLENQENFKSTVSFCEFLNEHPAYAKQYNDLKVELALKYPDNKGAYADGKAAFIEMVIDLAKRSAAPRCLPQSAELTAPSTGRSLGV